MWGGRGARECMWGESGTSERERMCGVKVYGMRVGIERVHLMRKGRARECVG